MYEAIFATSAMTSYILWTFLDYINKLSLQCRVIAVKQALLILLPLRF